MRTRWLILYAGLILCTPALFGTSNSKIKPSPRSINSAFRLEIEFDPGRADIKKGYDADIRRVVAYLNDYPYTKCEIRGYTDNVGSDTGNRKLSQQRADSVRRYMIDKLGLSPERLTARGYGKADPIASNRTDKGRRLNRRIVAVVTGQPPT